MIGTSILFLLMTTFISPLIPLIFFVLLVLLTIMKDYRLGTFLLIMFSFTNIAAQKFFESYHIMLFAMTFTIFSLSLSCLRRNIVIKGAKDFNLLLIIFGLWSFLSGVIAINHNLWLENIHWMLRAFILFYLIYNSFSTKEEIVIIFKIIVMSIFLSSFIPFFTSFGASFLSLKNLLPLFLQRFSGTIFDPNYFAMTVAASLPLAFILIIKEKHLILKLLWLFAILFLMFSVILSQSRTGLFSVAVIFLYTIFYLHQRKRREVFFIVVPLIIIIIAIPSVFWYRFSLFFQSILTGDRGDTSMGHRLILLSSAFDVFIKNPFFGVGLANFKVYAARYTQYPMIAHNTYLEIATGLGLLGLIPFLLILYKGFSILKSAIRDPNISELAWAVRAGLLGTYVAMLFLSVPFFLDFWVLLGLAFIIGKNSK